MFRGRAPGSRSDGGRGWSFRTFAFCNSRLLCACLGAALALVGASAAARPQSTQDWPTRIRACVREGHLQQAQRVVEEWLTAFPEDLDARAWHARLLSWTNRWKEAEQEYRELIRLSSNDVDLLAGLADVLAWQGRLEEALNYLNQACELDPGREDCRLRRARFLERLGRVREARETYQEVLTGNAASEEARKGLAQLRGPARYEVRLGADFDRSDYADNNRAYSAALRLRLGDHFSPFGSFSYHGRFGQLARRGEGGATVNLTRRDALTFSGAVARDNGIVPRAEAQVEFGHGFLQREEGPVRGVEVLYQQRWLWYRDARLQVSSPGVIFYLPKDWNWLFRFSTTRLAFTGTGCERKPSGWTRLAFPLGRRAAGSLHFAVGTENFGYVDQIRQYSAHTWGGSLRLRIAAGQDLLGYGEYQSRSEGQSLTNFGVSYAIRF